MTWEMLHSFSSPTRGEAYSRHRSTMALRCWSCHADKLSMGGSLADSITAPAGTCCMRKGGGGGVVQLILIQL